MRIFCVKLDRRNNAGLVLKGRRVKNCSRKMFFAACECTYFRDLIKQVNYGPFAG
jgi:hypothetical protein